MNIDISQIFITPRDTILDAIACIDRTIAKIALVVDQDQKLIDTITDGDVRRAILQNINLEESIDLLQDVKLNTRATGPISASPDTPDDTLKQIMQSQRIRQIPLIDSARKVVGLVRLQDLSPEESSVVQAVVMAGGLGSRLRPLTNDIPKPMLPIGSKPLIATIIEQLRNAGINQVNLATHFKHEIISEHFGNGSNFGVDINYVNEDKPLGTAGALGLLGEPDKPILVINGDVLTQVDFKSMIDFHEEHNAQMTIGVRQHDLQVPYGVVETDSIFVTGISEKPIVRNLINAGIYLLNPEICNYVPSGQHYDMPDLITRLISDNKRVVTFPVREYWLDIGRIEDYQQAIEELNNNEQH